jgi:hypothetical protein
MRPKKQTNKDLVVERNEEGKKRVTIVQQSYGEFGRVIRTKNEYNHSRSF